MCAQRHPWTVQTMLSNEAKTVSAHELTSDFKTPTKVIGIDRDKTLSNKNQKTVSQGVLPITKTLVFATRSSLSPAVQTKTLTLPREFTTTRPHGQDNRVQTTRNCGSLAIRSKRSTRTTLTRYVGWQGGHVKTIGFEEQQPTYRWTK